eukprot:SAG22_NODE_1123_length_5488_cov_53.464465_4_plen_87_part_00
MYKEPRDFATKGLRSAMGLHFVTVTSAHDDHTCVDSSQSPESQHASRQNAAAQTTAATRQNPKRSQRTERELQPAMASQWMRDSVM